MNSRDDVAAMVASDAHQGLIRRGAAHFLGPAVVTVDGDKAVAVCESLLVVHRDGGYTVWRPAPTTLSCDASITAGRSPPA
ncbi:snoaL-like domain protein [Mycobacterium xenopi 3993]|nr:snoaL-like domain protein [Mycobacterium xenopi 3993]